MGYDEPVREGLVDLRISINEAGKVTAVEVLDSFYDAAFLELAVKGLQGPVDYIDMVCANSVKKRLAFKNDFEWKIPDALKNCALEFQGAADSQFLLYQHLN